MLEDYDMNIMQYSNAIELNSNPPDILAIYLTARAFNVEVCIFTENLEWLCPSMKQCKSIIDICIFMIFNGGFKFTSTHKCN